jgi:hypothetical protein
VFDWNRELEVAKRQVAELDDKVTGFREKLGRNVDDPNAVVSTFAERDLRILSIRMASLDRAKRHLSFIEHKIGARAKGVDALPYAELAGVCFSAAKWMPPGVAADAVRACGAAFYAKAATKEKRPGPDDAHEQLRHSAPNQ